MMTLSEAIQHAEEKAVDENCCCRADHAQLAEWLKELQLRRFAASQPVYNPCGQLYFRNNVDYVDCFNSLKCLL